MGILDDAIREHLELKRQHGAESDDVERLEKEAFGPPTRPGDPDFAAPEDAGAGTAEAGATPAGAPGEADPPTSAEQARVESPELGDTADHPAPPAEPELRDVTATSSEESASAPPGSPPLSEPLPPGEPGPGPQPPEAPESSIFDAEDIDFGDLDLDLDADDEASGTPGTPGAAVDSNPFVTEEEEDLSLDLEEPLPPEEPRSGEPAAADPSTEEDTGNPPLPLQPREDDPAPSGRLEEPNDPEDSAGADDLLEETPDFLRDTPEGDRAWFEQDPPKDFDFDD